MDTTMANGQSACSDLNGEDRQRVLCEGGGDSAARGISGSHHFMNVFPKVEFQNNTE